MKRLLLRPGLLADVCAVTHLLFVNFVVAAELVVLVGWACDWGFVRNLPFRATHLGLVLFVFVQDLLGRRCPLTVWEERFRLLAGQTITGKPFIGRVVHRLLMCHLSEKAQRVLRMAFAVVVMVTFVVVQPRWSL